MRTNHEFTFDVNIENNTVHVVREFAAPREKVWAAWTQKEWLDQWWAPKPYKNQTKFLDFKEGGYWLYAMHGPEGSVHWCRADYQSVDPMNSYTYTDTFCDENGDVSEVFPGEFWTNTFIDNGHTTTVDVLIKYKDLANLEQIIKMGFKEGFTTGMDQLDKVLAS